MLKSLRRFAVSALRRVLSIRDMDLRLAKGRLYSMGASNAHLSGVLSHHDAPGAPNQRLLDLMSAVLPLSRKASLDWLMARGAPDLVNLWPGEHYRLLH